MAIFDAVRPDGEVGRGRSRLIAARAVADPLFDRLISSERVVAYLRGEAEAVRDGGGGAGDGEGRPEPREHERQAAIEYAIARGDHYGEINNRGWFALRRGEYEEALACFAIVQASVGERAPAW